MRTLNLGGLAAILVVGLAVDIAKAADADEDTPPKRQTTFNFGIYSLFGKGREDESRKLEANKELDNKTVDRETPIVSRREREFNAYLRRMDACDRLMDIAVATNNEDMQRRVEQLSERVWAVYQQNTGTSATQRPDRNDETVKQSGADRSANGNPRTASAGRE